MRTAAILSIFIVSLLLLGCSSKKNPYEKANDVLHEQTLMQTKKSSFKRDESNIAYILGVYINQVENDFIAQGDEKEYFIVGLYVSDKEASSISQNLHYTLNGISATGVKSLKNDDKVLLLLPSSNPWMQYSLLTFPNIQSRNLNLTAHSLDDGDLTLSFPKDDL